jgi:Protein of unknown function (DUF3060)
MSDHRSPEQEDPEQRIRDLERGLSDTSQQAPRYPAQLPNHGFSSTPGSMPTWSPPTPVPSNYPGASTFRPRRGGLRWIGMLVGLVFPIAMLVVFVVPWKDLGLFKELFGPTKVPHGGSLMVNESNTTKTVECNDGRLTLNGKNLQVTVTGHCANLFVNGWDHYVTVDNADSIRVNGGNTVVVYRSGQPAISKNGNVTVKRG